MISMEGAELGGRDRGGGGLRGAGRWKRETERERESLKMRSQQWLEAVASTGMSDGRERTQRRSAEAEAAVASAGLGNGRERGRARRGGACSSRRRRRENWNFLPFNWVAQDSLGATDSQVLILKICLHSFRPISRQSKKINNKRVNLLSWSFMKNRDGRSGPMSTTWHHKTSQHEPEVDALMAIGEGGGAATAPLLERRRERRGRATWFQTLGNVVVSVVGTGILGLPYAFRVAGWAAGTLAVAAAGLSTVHCMLLLVGPSLSPRS